MPDRDKAIDVRLVTSDNLNEIARLTGRDKLELRHQLETAKAHRSALFIFICKTPWWQEVAENYLRHDCELKGRCYYRRRWNNRFGYHWVCIIHNQASKYMVTEPNSPMPCLALDPTTTGL